MTEIKKRESLKMMLYAVGLISGLIFGFFIKKDNATVRLVFVILCIFAILSNIYLINALSHLSIVYDLNSEITESLIAEIILAIVGALLSAFIINPRHNGKKGGFGGGYYDRGGDYGGYSSGGYSSGGFSGGVFSGGGGSSGGGGASRHF